MANSAESNTAMVAKVALITGSSSGIGAATAKQLAREGYKVTICGTQKDKVDSVGAECVKLSPQNFHPLCLVLDFSVPENGELVVERTIENFGRLDAGCMGWTSSEDPDSYDLYKQLTAVNMDAMVRSTLAAVAELKRTRGNLLFVSSIASNLAFPNAYAYCMTKAAMTSFAKCLALDLAPLVRVNIVSPGPVKTDILQRMGVSEEMAAKQWSTYTPPLGRVGQSEEIAEAICFLLSDRASFIHGNELFIDGGMLILHGNNKRETPVEVDS